MNNWTHRITNEENQFLMNFIDKINSGDKFDQKFLAVIGTKNLTIRFLIDLQDLIGIDECKIINVNDLNNNKNFENLVKEVDQNLYIKCVMVNSENKQVEPTTILSMVTTDKIQIRYLNEQTKYVTFRPNLIIASETDEYINLDGTIKRRCIPIYLR